MSYNTRVFRQRLGFFGRFGILGDSISASGHNASMMIINKLGGTLVYNGAVPGSFIPDQLSKVQYLVSNKCQYCLLMVGTNEAQESFSLSDVYTKYNTLLTSILDAGISPILLYIPPLQSWCNERTHKINMAMYFVAQNLGVPVFSIWEQFGLSAGGWIASSTYGDDVHPLPSSCVLASAAGFDLISQLKTSHPRQYTKTGSMIANSVFNSPSANIAQNWKASFVGSTYSYVNSSIGALGDCEQHTILTNPANQDRCSVVSDAITFYGMNVGDKLRLSVFVDVVSPDSFGGGCSSFVQIVQYDSFDNPFEFTTSFRSSCNVNTNITLNASIVSDASYAKVFLSISNNSGSMLSGVATAKWTQCVLTNLTSIGVP